VIAGFWTDVRGWDLARAIASVEWRLDVDDLPIEVDPANEPPAEDETLPEDVRTDTPAAKDDEDEDDTELGGEG